MDELENATPVVTDEALADLNRRLDGAKLAPVSLVVEAKHYPTKLELIAKARKLAKNKTSKASRRKNRK